MTAQTLGRAGRAQLPLDRSGDGGGLKTVPPSVPTCPVPISVNRKLCQDHHERSAGWSCHHDRLGRPRGMAVNCDGIQCRHGGRWHAAGRLLMWRPSVVGRSTLRHIAIGKPITRRRQRRCDSKAVSRFTARLRTASWRGARGRNQRKTVTRLVTTWPRRWGRNEG